MPTYGYKCLDCKEEFVVVRKMTEKTETCICCKSKNIQQVIKPSNFILKGNGWFNKGGY